MLTNLALGIFLAGSIAALAYWRKLLNPSGAWCACLLGTLVFGFGGWQASLLLISFFLTSSTLSRFKRRLKQSVEQAYQKGSTRDAGQVLANGGLFTAFIVLAYWLPFCWVLAVAALASANADTWATELGGLARTAPRLITNGRRVPAGTSGAISPQGTLASLAGAGLIAGLAALLPGLPAPVQAGWLWLTLCGLVGSLLDSLLGATLQAQFTCRKCGKQTEQHPTHACGGTVAPARGLGWLNNDLVNFLANVMATLLAGFLLIGMPNLLSK